MAGSYPSPTFAGVTLNSPLSVANGGTGVTSVSGVAGAISAAFYTPTIADLRGLTSSTTATTCNVANFATAGDQGGGTFVVDAADTTSGALFTGSLAPVNAPAAPTLGSTSGGTLAATTYYVKLTYNTAAGQTLPSSESSLAVAADYLLVVASPASATGVTSYNVYVSTSTGAETLQASGIAIGTSWTEPTSGLVAGAAFPTASTAGSILDVTAINTGSIVVNNGVYGANVAAGTIVVAQAGGTGSTGNYLVNGEQTVSSEFMTSDNGGTIIVDQAGRRWYRQYSGAVNVRWFGATGNGTTDDTAAIQQAENNTNQILYFPAGKYLINTTGIVKKTGVSWTGDGRFQSVIVAETATWYGNVVGSISDVSNLTISNIGFDTSGVTLGAASTTSGVVSALNFFTGSQVEITNCAFVGIQLWGLFFGGGSNVQITKNYFSRASASANFNEGILTNPTNAQCNNFVIDGNVLENTGMAPIIYNSIVSNNFITGWGYGSGITMGLGTYRNAITGNFIGFSATGADVNGVHPAGIEQWSNFSTCAGNVCVGCAGSGINSGGSGSSITGNVCLSNATGASTSLYEQAGIVTRYVSSTINGNASIISSNICFDSNGASGTQKYGYVDDGTSVSDVHLIDNNFLTNVTAPMNASGIRYSFRGPKLTATITGVASFTIAAGGNAGGVTVGVNGAEIGDMVEVALNTSLSGLIVTAWVPSAGNVSFTYFNPSGASVTIPAYTAYITVNKYFNFPNY